MRSGDPNFLILQYALDVDRRLMSRSTLPYLGQHPTLLVVQTNSLKRQQIFKGLEPAFDIGFRWLAEAAGTIPFFKVVGQQAFTGQKQRGAFEVFLPIEDFLLFEIGQDR